MISVTASDNLAQAKNSASKSDIVGSGDVRPCPPRFISPIASARIALPGQAGEGQAYGTQQRPRQCQETLKTPEKD